MIDGIPFYQNDIIVVYSSTSASLKIYQPDPKDVNANRQRFFQIPFCGFYPSLKEGR